MDLNEAVWRKAGKSTESGNCVEVALNLPGVVAIRDSKDPGGPVLEFARTEWEAFITGIQRGEFG